MKKFLLFALVAMVAMTANAKTPYKLNVQTMAPKSSMALKAQNMLVTDGKIQHKAPAKAEEEANILPMVEIGYDWLDDEDGTSFNVCSSVFITKTGETAAYNGVPMEKIHIDGLCQGYASVDAYMNEEKIVIPKDNGKDCYTYPGYDPMFLDVALIVNNALEYKEGDIVFVNNGGIWELEEENAYGMAIRMTGEYDGYVWNYSPYCSIVEANGEENGYFTTGSWAPYSNPIYVEQSEEGDEIHIYNFYGAVSGAHLVMYVDTENEEDPTAVLIPTFQTIAAVNTQRLDASIYGYDYHLVGHEYNPETERFTVDEDKEYVTAHFIDEKTIAFDENEMTGVFTLFDEEGSGYWMGRQQQVSFTLNEGLSFTADIKNVNSDNKKKDNKLYSISGQQVDKNFKGIVINNGKKFLQK